MKKANFLYGACAAFALAGFTACSSDDNAPTNPEGNGDRAYVAINIMTPGESGSRADAVNGPLDADNFDNGVDAEHAVNQNKVLFVFFDNAGTFSKAVSPTDVTFTDATTPDHITKISSVVTISDIKVAPEQVVVVLNSDLTASDLNTNKPNLENFMNQADDFSSHTSGAFVMSNSVSSACKAAKVSAYSTAEAATNATPDEVYVERVVAKATVTNNADDYSFTSNTSNDNGTISVGTALVNKVLGFDVIRTQPNAKLVKDLGNYSASDWFWDDPTRFRSYWEVTPAISTDNALDSKTWSSLNTTDTPLYFHPHTSGTFSNGTNTVTGVVVKARLQAANTAEDATEFPTYIDWHGTYYSEEGFKTLAASWLQKIKYTEDATDNSAWLNDIEIVQVNKNDKEWKVKAALKSTCAASDDAKTKATAILNAQDAGWQYTGGANYYFIPIKHINDEYAVVRNHSYQITVSGIEGLGTPVFDPDEYEIIPDIPDDITYTVAAKINIQKWRIVPAQNVTLGNGTIK